MALYKKALAMGSDWEGAIALLDQALAVQPENSQILTAKIGALLQMGRWEDAVATSDALVKTDPSSPSFWLVKIACLQSPETILEVLNEAISINPMSVPLHLRKVQQLIAMNRNEEAEKVSNIIDLFSSFLT